MMTRRTTREENQKPAKAGHGFSLIELLVVVAIILIIAAIAIPNFLRSRMAANEASAAENVRSITTAAVVYSTTWDNGYPPSLGALGGTSNPATCDKAILLDPNLTNPPNQTSGYTFAYMPQGPTVTAGGGCTLPGYNAYVATAVPTIAAVTGTRSFCSTQPGTIHVAVGGGPIASQAACNALPALQ